MKMMIIKDAVTNQELAKVRVKKLESLFNLNSVLTPEMIGLPEGCRIVSTGIRSFSTKGLIMSNDPEMVAGSEEVHTGRNSAIIGPGASRNANFEATPVEVMYPGESKPREINLKLAVTVYPEGYIINSGKSSVSIFGSQSKMYFSSIGEKNFKCSAASGARIFSDLNSVIKYLEKNKDTFHYMVTEYSYDFSVEPACSLFAESLSECPKKDQKHLAQLEDLLEVINTLPETEDYEDEFIEGEASENEMKEEAINRLHSLGVMDKVIDNFKVGKLFMSEFGGVLYDLNDQAKEAVNTVKEQGNLPYAVCLSHMEFGDLYAVLFVSQDREEWSYERPDRKGFCLAYVYNADNPEFSEYGSIQITAANGGLVRTA